MRAILIAAALVLLCQSCIRAEDSGDKQFTSRAAEEIIQGNIETATKRVLDLINKPTPKPQETTSPEGTTTAGSLTTLPPPSTKTPNYLNPIVSATTANKYQPFVEQAGSPGIFPSANSPAFNLGPGTSRYLVIGDWGRIGSAQSLGLDQCSAKDYGGNNDVQGALQQTETALLADQVCGLLGGCQAVIGTGDNFYQCGVYPGDTTSRFQSDWSQIYQTPKTPNLQGLTWYQTFGNHDMVITGSVEAQIDYSKTNPKWQIPSNYFLVDLPTTAGGPKIRAFFIDANPFIASYNVTGQKYNKAYYKAHLNATYIDGQIAWLQSNLASSTADYNIVVGHYPLFGSATQYGFDQTGKATSPYPGNFNAWQKLLTTIYNNKATAYMNGHDHVMTAGNPTQPGAPVPYNGHTVFLTSGAGSWGEPADSCGPANSKYYTNGGNGGFIIVSANASTFQSDFFVLGSLFSQCTITAFADKTRAPIISENCALGLPNSCCSAPSSACYR